MKFLVALYFLSIPFAHADIEPCRLISNSRFCTIGGGESADRGVSIDRGTVRFTEVYYEQDTSSQLTCPVLGQAHVLSAEVRLEGWSGDTGTQLGGTAYAKSFENNIHRDGEIFVVTSLNRNGESGFDFDSVTSFRIPVKGAYQGNISLVEGGHSFTLPVTCR